MSLVSIVVPSRNERFLGKTVDDLLTKARGNVEVIAICDGYDPDPPLPEDARLRVVRFGAARGMRACINAGAAIARGGYLMKCDAHCMFAEGFDEVLKEDYAEDNWVLIPRRWSLDPENWAIEENGKGPRDYHYLSCPEWSIRERDDYSMHGLEWPERTKARQGRPEYDVDETMSWQGSMWFMSRSHWRRLGDGMSEDGYGTFSQEPQQIGLATQLGGGAIMVTKHTWYAHLHKGKRYGRGYHQDGGEIGRGHDYSARYWMSNAWPDRVHNIEWLVDRFWPVPTWDQSWIDQARAEGRVR